MNLTPKLKEACKKDVLTYAYTHINLPQRRAWDHRKWAPEIYNAVNPYLVEKGQSARKVSVIKSTQAGLTTAGIVKILHAMTEFDLSVAYSLPRLQDVQDLDKAKLGPIIRGSEYISSKIGHTDTTTNKEIGNAFLFLMHLTTEPRMLSVDMVVNDEIDLSDPNHLSVMPNRMDDPNSWKLSMNYSTPTVAGHGIHALFQKSSQHEWLVPCPSCGRWQELHWDHNIRVEGFQYDPDSVDYICSNCDSVLSLEHIKNEGEWVAKDPKMIPYHLGYHVSQMFIYPAEEMWQHYINPESSLQEFYRKRLGIPYSAKDKSKSLEWLQENIPRNAKLESGRFFLGVDQKNVISFVVIRRQGDVIEIVDAWEDDGEFQEAVERAWSMYPIAGTIIDADPNRNTATKLAKSRELTWVSDYHHSVKSLYTVSKDIMLTVLRSQAFDDVFQRMDDGNVFYSHDGGPLPNGIKSLFTHLSHMKRDVEERRTHRGSEQKVFWRAVGPDDYAHALLYAIGASTLTLGKDKKGKARVIRIGDEKRSEEDKDKKPKGKILRIR